MWLQINHYFNRIGSYILSFWYNGYYFSRAPSNTICENDTWYLIDMIVSGMDSNLQRFIYAAQHDLIVEGLVETMQALKTISM